MPCGIGEDRRLDENISFFACVLTARKWRRFETRDIVTARVCVSSEPRFESLAAAAACA